MGVMNVSEMSDQEKSLVLARLCGWHIAYTKRPSDVVDLGILHYYGENLYDPANMALAWRVLNWAYLQHDVIDDGKYGRLAFGHVVASHFCDTCGARMMYPREAQAAWLDKILELAIDAGMVTAVSEEAS